jgi:DNA repair exonuclease SbcCD nuclease subunit
MKNKNYYKKCAMFTDIHFGRMANSSVHNQDCLDYIDWFCDNVSKDKEIDCIVFIGDWYEHRSSVDGLTLKYSYNGAKRLNELGLPIFMIIGNHDLYYRTNREVYTTNFFESFENITIVNEPTVFSRLGKKGSLVSPYLFHDEYDKLLAYMDIPVWFGHFEFKGFVLTGEHVVMEHGTDHTNFKSIKKIFSGHFHKRQNKDNVHFIGNCFPADFSDAGDVNRGMATYNFDTDTVKYINWDDCPKYINVTLSQLLEEHESILCKNARVECLVDIDITLQEDIDIRTKYMEMYELREMRLKEINNLQSILAETEHNLSDDELNAMTTEESVVLMLTNVKSDKIKNTKLQEIFRQL